MFFPRRSVCMHKINRRRHVYDGYITLHTLRERLMSVAAYRVMMQVSRPQKQRRGEFLYKSKPLSGGHNKFVIATCFYVCIFGQLSPEIQTRQVFLVCSISDLHQTRRCPNCCIAAISVFLATTVLFCGYTTDEKGFSRNIQSTLQIMTDFELSSKHHIRNT